MEKNWRFVWQQNLYWASCEPCTASVFWTQVRNAQVNWKIGTRRAIIKAVREGLLTEADVDRALRRILRTRARLGLFDPPEEDPWKDLGADDVDTPEHRAVALRTARESVVLLKNAVPLALDGRDGSPDKSVSLDAFAGMLLNPQIEIRVGIMSIDANKTGKAASKSNVVGSEIFLFHGSDNPTQYDPGFAKTFSVGANSVEAVRLYREERNRSDILAVDWSEDVQVVSAICAKRITVS